MTGGDGQSWNGALLLTRPFPERVGGHKMAQPRDPAPRHLPGPLPSDVTFLPVAEFHLG